MITRITRGILVFAAMFAMFAESAVAVEQFQDGAKIKISKFHEGETDATFVLTKTGDDEQGDGIYYLTCADDVVSDKGYFMKFDNAEEGGKLLFTNSEEERQKWVLHDNGSGWSIIPRKNGALAISLKDDGKNKEFQRNQGAKHQKWEIEEVR